MPGHKISTEQLLAFASGELNTAERAAIAQHLLECATCAETVERIGRLRAVLQGTVSEEPPQNLIARAQAIHQPFARSPRQTPQQSRRSWRLFLQPGAMLALLLVFILLGGSLRVLAATADDSLPGDALYPLKRAHENVQLALTWDMSAQIEQHLSLAQTRRQELQALVSQGRFAEVPETGRAAQAQMDEAVALLTQLAGLDKARAAVLAPSVSDALAVHVSVLSDLLDAVPSAAQPGLEQAISASQHAQSGIQSTIAPAGFTPKPAAPPAEATATLVQGNGPPGPKDTPSGLGGTPPGAGKTSVPPAANPTSPDPKSNPPVATRTPASASPANTPRGGSGQTPAAPQQTRTPSGPNRTPVAPDTHGGR
jgi:uncharacterized protein DUF5667/putative zinc finger protein